MEVIITHKRALKLGLEMGLGQLGLGLEHSHHSPQLKLIILLYGLLLGFGKKDRSPFAKMVYSTTPHDQLHSFMFRFPSKFFQCIDFNTTLYPSFVKE